MHDRPSRQFARRSRALGYLKAQINQLGDHLTPEDRRRIATEIATLKTWLTDNEDRPTKKLLAFASQARRNRQGGKLSR